MLLLCTFFYADAATITSTSTGGNWNDGTTWVGGVKPGSSDDVVIAPNAVVLMDAANVTAGIVSLTVAAGSSLQMSSSAVNNIRFNIKGNIVNNGTINFWLSSTSGASLYLTGSSSTWSGNGAWNLAQLFISNSALEFNSDLSITINRTISVGTGSLNALNKRSGVTFILSGTENATLASENASIFYGNIIADKSNRVITFAQTGTTDAYNQINILGDITLKPTNRLTIGSYNILDIPNNLSGSGRIVGGTNSDVQISGSGAAILFNSGGSGFRNFTVTRPNGATIDSTVSVYQTLSLQNQCKLYLPAGKSANGNQTFTVGQSASAGTIIGDGYLAQQAAANAYQLTDLTINGTAAVVNLRFSQTSNENVVHNLTINKASGSVNLLDGGMLQVKNTATITNGTFNIGSGTLKLTGSIVMNANGTLTGSSLANLIIGNDVSSSNATLYFNQTDAQSRSLKSYIQTRNGTITLANPVEVNTLVDLNSTSTANILNAASNLTLISNQAGTARVNTLGAASIIDSVIVQRFIKGSDISRRGYRLLSSPVYQVNNANSSLRRFYFSRLQDQILITGAGGAANGFDPSPANGPTIWKYNEPAANTASQDFTPIGSISKNHSITSQDFLTSANGFFLFFRGDRTNNLNNKTTAPFPVPEDVIISYKGLLNQGNITVTAPSGATGLLSYTNHSESNDGFNLAGNPYPSAIDWELSGGSGAAIVLTNLNPTIYILDPVTKNYGTYTKGGVSTGAATRYIASGQGFFIKANNANPAMMFTEAAKATDTSNPAVLGGKTPLAMDFLRLKLQQDSLNQDDILLTFKDGQSEDYHQEEDVDDLTGMNASVSLSALSKTEKKLLAVDALPQAKQVSTIALFVDAAANGHYQLKLTDLSDNFKNTPVFLKDNFTADSVDLHNQPHYAFFIDKNNTATFGSGRFTIYFGPDLTTSPSVANPNASVVNPLLNISGPASVMLYPNPATTEVNFLIGKRSISNIRLTIYNNNGIKIHSSVHQNQTSIKHNVAMLPAGVYVAELQDIASGATLQNIKFIKN
ncbi:T9SS type A sorting domain-containing protein [Mucilaginibacter arboris]|uniref:T9SS type A sorting domain-containing protein n=1 Tax=Mucilaginibacter arboris TaxID=2682090 RepID=A0A7K1SX67_9SPHI|nr:T9SS type A sorting domain-containing protein [Mucilaginibacter arboris]MVN21827.1 T9SS type A sorting domain-containing protein [Mucilaginibacter arboris]